MNKHEVLLSTGTVPFLGLERGSNYAQKIEYDGLEVLPLRHVVREIKRSIRTPGVESVKSIHRSWVLDSNLEREHGLEPRTYHKVLRLILFPSTNESREMVGLLSKVCEAPVVIHDISPKWTRDAQGQEFTGGLLLELSSHQTRSLEEIKTWLEEINHNMVVDTRDDQSVFWATKQGFENWQKYWPWLGLEKIRSVQLTLMGKRGMNEIFNHRETLAEQQLLWLNKQGWNGPVTIEVNPLTLFIGTRGKIGKGLQEIGFFVRKTLDEGKFWSY